MRHRATVVLALLAPLLAAQDPPAPKEPAFGSQWNAAVGLGGSGLFGLRGPGKQCEPKVAAAIDAGLGWLAKAQVADGHWGSGAGADVDVAVTSLAVLAILGEGSTLRMGTHKNPLKLGVRWLRDHQREDGAFADATGPHLLATLAMTEAYHSARYTLIKPNAQKGLQHLAQRRHEDGGWLAHAGAAESDPALTLWGITLLGTARVAGLLADEHPYDGVAAWLAGPRAGVIAETSVLGVAAPASRQPELAFDQQMANAFARCWLASPDPKAADLERAQSLPRRWAAEKGARLSIQEWFCSSHLLAEAGDTAAVAAIANGLVAAQSTDGADAGSWPPLGVFGEAGGRVWTTAMAVMALGAGRRYSHDIAKWVR